MHSSFFGRLTAALLIGSLAATPVLAQEAPPALPVSVSKPIARTVVDWLEFPGRFEAAASVEVRAQVAGALQSVNFTDGQDVKAGDLLFKIDPRLFEATLRQAQAAAEGNKTVLDLATAEVRRAQELRQSGNIAEQTLQQRQQSFLQAQANLNASNAEIESAQLNLGYTEIRAPVSGRVGRKLVTEGNLIASGSGGTLLTTIVQYDPIHFYFDVDEQSYLAYQRRRIANPEGEEQGRQVLLALPDETEFKHEGRLDFFDNSVDQATGTVRVRAVLPNANSLITPGQFGRIKMATGAPYEALLLPSDAVMADQTRSIVMVVTADGTVQPRPVQLGGLFGKFRVIRDGVGAEDQVIVNGLMRARPGAKVVPQPAELDVPQDLTRPQANGG
ncbi:efflux RND transporter periplasmic adaptor subunit [Terrihabitans sp. B22-R8]|uniref:efflux RND transporter periplasmic adaptor subunit n=1 Tax=Terrihabitans sp. B22-R8 TaxID=3425128 RepID=UPI00403CC0F7